LRHLSNREAAQLYDRNKNLVADSASLSPIALNISLAFASAIIHSFPHVDHQLGLPGTGFTKYLTGF
jgi:hypothetical protein